MARRLPNHSQTLALPIPPRPDADHYEPSGIICIVDVEKFSTIDTRKRQIDLVRELWHASQRTDLIKLADPPAHINGTGDGLLIAVRLTPERIHQALRWARDLIHDAQIARFDKKLRFGLHCGSYTVLGGDPGKLAVGTALNVCTRVSSIGDGGHVIVSEDFVKQYADQADWPAIVGVFEPSEKDKHYLVSTKHGARVPFRIYRVNDTTPPAPHRLKLVQIANKNLYNVLPKIEEAFRAGLRGSPRVTPPMLESIDHLDIRVCLFEPDHDRQVLVSDQFRYHKNNRHLRPSEAEYSIRGQGTGVCGRAFCTKQPVVLHNLPIRSDDDKLAYDSYHVRLGVSQPSIDKWQRHARSLIAFPFAVMEQLEMESALGVVCVDVMEPLEWIDAAELELIDKDMMGQFGILLGALCSLRF